MADSHKSDKRSLIMAAVVCLGLFELGILIAGFSRSLQGNGDFSAFYRTAVMVKSGEFHRLYDASSQLAFDQKIFPSLDRFPPYYFYHPPFEALVLMPLAFLSYRTALWLWSFLSFLLILLSGTVLSNHLPELRPFFGMPINILLLTSFPLVMVFLQGQDSALLLLLVALAYSQFERRREVSCGILLGLSLFKFQFIIPLAAILTFRLSYKFAMSFATTAATLMGISWMLAGTAGLRDYFQMLVQGTPEMVWRMPNLRGAVESLGGSPLLVVALALALSAWCALRLAQFESGGFALALVCAFLVSYHAHVYDCLLLVIPVLCALQTAISNQRGWIAFWPILFFGLLPVYVLLTRWHATWIFAGFFLLLAIDMGRASTKVACDPIPVGEALP